ncbi:MAG: hypothetical protein VKK97_10205 [Synechococcaceae cyanobacterium]|nr:hypothetical protein [Synechococcaceae cyanobacterium]
MALRITTLFRSLLDAEQQHRSDMLELRNRQRDSQEESEYELIEQKAVGRERAQQLLLCEMAGIPYLEYVCDTFECARRREDEEAMAPFRYAQFPDRNARFPDGFRTPLQLLLAAMGGDMVSPYHEMLWGEIG